MSANTGAAPTARYGTVEHFLGLLLPGGLPPESACPGRLVSTRTLPLQNQAPRPAARDRDRAAGRRRKP
ncbi:hypothetical protein [Streptomyces sp. NPDC000983]|uniref:hypothetical protein n=1 Tax=Streptomyces sp. NPDC000983 TaxID=3154373 RepID=UPI00331E0490